MPQPGLVELAQRLVELDREAAEVRGQMLRFLQANGAAPDPPARPIDGRPGPRPGARPRRRARAVDADDSLIALLKQQPMGPAEIMKATGAGRSTVGDRLRKLKARGFVTRTEDGWSATS
jgi:hypothetical protein